MHNSYTLLFLNTLNLNGVMCSLLTWKGPHNLAKIIFFQTILLFYRDITPPNFPQISTHKTRKTKVDSRAFNCIFEHLSGCEINKRIEKTLIGSSSKFCLGIKGIRHWIRDQQSIGFLFQLYLFISRIKYMWLMSRKQ